MARSKAGCIGTGVMGSALMESVAAVAGADQVLVFDTDTGKADAFARKTGCRVAKSSREIAETCDFVFLAVKPGYLGDVLSGIAPALTPATILVSMAAGVARDTIRTFAGESARIVRIMPNTPASVATGMIALAPDTSISAGEIDELRRLLGSAGLTEITDEKNMDAITAVSGSGPAYGFLFIEALSDAGVRMGLSRDQSIRFAAQTLKGAAEMVLKTGTHPAMLKDAVCSPGGTTIAAVEALEAHGFRSAVISAALAAWERSIELGKPKN
ncbi:MAG TPA: pyrroline-5-carboxylate reductase [Treponemataceae bacterium]|nr:pyrroline-5-carboxylate reductase [Treponemataceae bacterium]